MDTEISLHQNQRTSAGRWTKSWLKRDKKGLFLKDKDTWITGVQSPDDD